MHQDIQTPGSSTSSHYELYGSPYCCLLYGCCCCEPLMVTSSSSGYILWRQQVPASSSDVIIYRHLPTSTVFIQFRSSSTVYYVITFYYVVIFGFLLLVWTVSELGYMIPANWVGVDIFSSRLLTDCPIYCMHVIPSFYLQVFCSELLHCDCWSRMDASTLHLLYCCTVWHCCE